MSRAGRPGFPNLRVTSTWGHLPINLRRVIYWDAVTLIELTQCSTTLVLTYQNQHLILPSSAAWIAKWMNLRDDFPEMSLMRRHRTSCRDLLLNGMPISEEELEYPSTSYRVMVYGSYQ